MDKALRSLLRQVRSCEVSLRGKTVDMVLLPAGVLLELQCAGEGAESAFAEALRGNAALAAKCLRKDGEAIFANGDEVLNTLSAEEIHAVVERYRVWSAEVDPSYGSDKERIEAIKKV